MSDPSDAAAPETDDGLQIIYDGDCPFCSAYIRLVRLREAVGGVELVDARAHPDLVRDFQARGVDLNETMVVRYAGQLYAGADAIHLLSVLSSRSGRANRFLARIFCSARRARHLYPWLRAGRNLTLRLLGREKLNVSV
jgi:predicted DCC family thiol-disulfide oxidoreductase YuxK